MIMIKKRQKQREAMCCSEPHRPHSYWAGEKIENWAISGMLIDRNVSIVEVCLLFDIGAIAFFSSFCLSSNFQWIRSKIESKWKWNSINFWFSSVDRCCCWFVCVAFFESLTCVLCVWADAWCWCCTQLKTRLMVAYLFH